MKRSNMVLQLQKVLTHYKHGGSVEKLATEILNTVERLGMKPPHLGGEKYQALAHVYIDPSGNMWDEEFEQDEKAVAAYKRRMNKNG